MEVSAGLDGLEKSDLIMAKTLFNDHPNNPVSPLIDVVMNGMAAMFIILMVYMAMARPEVSTEIIKLPTARVGVPYDVKLDATWGMENKGNGAKGILISEEESGIEDSSLENFEIVSGSLPPDVDIFSSSIKGTPTGKGIYRFDVGVRGSVGRESIVYQLEVLENIKHSLELPKGRVGEEYFGSVSIDEKTENDTVIWFEEVDGLRPSSNEGALRGVPRTAGTFSVSYVIKNGETELGRGGETLRILPSRKALEININDKFDMIVEEETVYKLSASGGEGEYNWNLRGKLPPGISFNDDRLEGVLRESGQWNIRATVQDKISKETVDKDFVIDGIYADGSKPRLLSKTIPKAFVDIPFEFEFSATGGVGIAKFEMTGKLPDGLTFTEIGIKGIPRESGSSQIKVVIIDEVGQGQDDPSFFDVNVADSMTPRITTERLPVAISGEEYDFALSATGGIGKYGWGFSGDLPNGLYFSENGIKGIIGYRAFGNWRVKAMVSDESGQRSDIVTLTLQVKNLVPRLCVNCHKLMK